MSYVGYVIEEMMHERQADVERFAAGYRQRHAARAGRRSSRRLRNAGAEGTVRSAAAPSRAQASSATC